MEYSQAGKAFVFGTNIQRFEPFYSNNVLYFLCQKYNRITKISLYRLVVRTPPFHGCNTGSNPVKDKKPNDYVYITFSRVCY